MFDSLTDRLSKTVKHLRGQARLTEDNISDALREVRMALLEADVALPVVKEFIAHVQERSVGKEVHDSLNPGQMLVKIVNDELISLMGSANEEINLKAAPPAVILMAGLQGAGKTTTVAKLARWIHEKKGKSVLVVSTDVYRPAAIDQLAMLAAEIGVEAWPADKEQSPLQIARQAIEHARKQFIDVVIVDTAGRLHVDDAMMAEISEIHRAVSPVETLFVVDSMTGQDAANTAQAFNSVLPLSGVILTKADGDARGGAALSVRKITGKPIKFLGVGEKSTALEPFYPDRLASRILGMGDVLSLIEEVEAKADRKQAEKLASKLKKGKGFDLEDFRDQLRQMQNLGGVAGLMDKLPGMKDIPQQARDQVNDTQFRRLEAIINSMTPQERRLPKVINGSRKRRIASGSGTRVQDVNRLLKQFMQMQKMMKRMSKKGGMARLLQGKKPGMPGGMPF
jgi:signal recognition particle subunit SRP54